MNRRNLLKSIGFACVMAMAPLEINTFFSKKKKCYEHLSIHSNTGSSYYSFQVPATNMATNKFGIRYDGNDKLVGVITNEYGKEIEVPIKEIVHENNDSL